ncbi:hypothetical protein SASPL_124311 [Salvia splendens]|uniref:TCP domain-containing protein n=1 Tax=Salvia splendens TaxID=180675 RepID=A0A8X8XRH9_SALSN|nr:transcription factor PCF5-like [Salvia splendens]KAG6416870.1 hypothetical protein SASPL_124311 [Salvia splendens]
MKDPAQGGEIVEVEGGQILRATGRKDRHSKVYTAKGPRDRRVRLAAHTAIQFYDVQDRLGYDRPSKAVDWLIKKAKTAIDNLNDLPLPPPQPGWGDGAAWSHSPATEPNPSSAAAAREQHQSQVRSEYNFAPNTSRNNNSNNNNNNNNSASSFMGEADLMNTMKSLFPTSSFAGFDNDSSEGSSFQTRDLGLSLQTLQADSRANPTAPFQGNFHWSSGGAVFASFSERELLQSNAAENTWNQRPQRPLIPPNHHDQDPNLHQPQPRSAFELGFRVPARIYGEEEAAENHR